MSEMVHYSGKLIEVERLENQSLEEQCKKIMQNEGNLPRYYDSYEEWLICDGSDKEDYIIYNSRLYKANTKEIDPYGDVFIATKNDDGSINFEVQYYNGGCGFSEAVKYALENLEENNE